MSNNGTPLSFAARMKAMKFKVKQFEAKQRADENSALKQWAALVDRTGRRLEAVLLHAIELGDTELVAKAMIAAERLAKRDAERRAALKPTKAAARQGKGHWEITLNGVLTTGSRAKCGNAYRVHLGLNPFYSSAGLDSLNCNKLGEQYPEFLELCKFVPATE